MEDAARRLARRSSDGAEDEIDDRRLLGGGGPSVSARPVSGRHRCRSCRRSAAAFARRRQRHRRRSMRPGQPVDLRPRSSRIGGQQGLATSSTRPAASRRGRPARSPRIRPTRSAGDAKYAMSLEDATDDASCSTSTRPNELAARDGVPGDPLGQFADKWTILTDDRRDGKIDTEAGRRTPINFLREAAGHRPRRGARPRRATHVDTGQQEASAEQAQDASPGVDPRRTPRTPRRPGGPARQRRRDARDRRRPAGPGRHVRTDRGPRRRPQRPLRSAERPAGRRRSGAGHRPRHRRPVQGGRRTSTCPKGWIRPTSTPTPCSTRSTRCAPRSRPRIVETFSAGGAEAATTMADDYVAQVADELDIIRGRRGQAARPGGDRDDDPCRRRAVRRSPTPAASSRSSPGITGETPLDRVDRPRLTGRNDLRRQAQILIQDGARGTGGDDPVDSNRR